MGAAIAVAQVHVGGVVVFQVVQPIGRDLRFPDVVQPQVDDLAPQQALDALGQGLVLLAAFAQLARQRPRLTRSSCPHSVLRVATSPLVMGPTVRV